ncbi:helix-turn-helix transcriptional regulator [Amycolatopsis minnesotensis]|uniref:HTH cro/C1-type domain-containing protein n=1 Tax=Amycolatopsis minnesotensis TaxID=337894 RepID=A0ABN2SUC5_9PSEU
MAIRRDALVRARKMAGHSQESLAEALHVAPSSISNWERGRTEPVPYKRPKLAKLLGVTVDRLDELLHGRAPLTTLHAEGPESYQPSGITSERVGNTGISQAPREFASPTVPWSEARDADVCQLEADVCLPGGVTVPAATARTEPALAESLLITLQQYAATDNLTGSHSLLPIAAQHMVVIEHLLQGSRGRTHAQLLGVSARFAEFTGWLHQDTGHLQAATHWSNTALAFAEEAADLHLISYIRMRKSNIASDARNPALVVTFAQAALQNPAALTPRLKAVALRQEAHGYALAGDHDACARVLDQALQHAVDAPDDETDIAGYCTPGYVEMEAAHCWVELGKPAKALATLPQGLARWNPHFRRDLGLCLARLAVAHAGSGQLDEAFSVAQHSLTIASDTRSQRTARQLRRTSELLTSAGAADQAHYLRRTIQLALR